MSLSSVIVAFWLYSGRSLLLGLLSSTGVLNKNIWPPPLSIAIGLLITPLVLAIFSGWLFVFQATLLILLSFDLILLYFLLRNFLANRITVSKHFYLILLFSLLVTTLSWFNGPYIEHLTDAWWHMRRVFWLTSSDSLIFSKGGEDSAGFLYKIYSATGSDYSSYRLQAFLVWILNSSVVDSWIASSIAVSGILATSIYLLLYSLRLNSLALCFSLVFWLVFLGGMNSGLRLGGWPAGMGYVFLNLGLIASYQLFLDIKSSRAWSLLLCCIIGTSFFHLAELFLLIVAVSSIILFKLFYFQSNIRRSILVLIFLAITYLLFFYMARESELAVLPAFLQTGLLIFTLWLIVTLFKHFKSRSIYFFGLCIGTAVAWQLIDWQHLNALFKPPSGKSAGYYNDYIPLYIQSWGGKSLIISKWEHQLRSSLLWSGVIGLVLALWNNLFLNSRLSQWLMILMLVPWIILASPGIFTMISSFVPIYGTYRVQFLMPIAIVFGVVASSSIIIITKRNSIIGSLNGGPILSKLLPKFSHSTLYFSGIAAFSIFLYITYFAGLNLVNNFADYNPPDIIGYGILLAGVIFALLRISLRKVFYSFLLSLGILVALPDAMTRLGIINERPWAIGSNLMFHWRLANNRDAIFIHSSLRYQQDIKKIRELIDSNKNNSFISDVATSYYIAAETDLRPVVQQAHHSTTGLRFKELFQAFCNNEISDSEFANKIFRINQKRQNKNTDNIKYIIINRDTLNYTAEVLGTSCVGETDHLVLGLDNIADLAHKGEFLSLWKINN